MKELRADWTQEMPAKIGTIFFVLLYAVKGLYIDRKQLRSIIACCGGGA